MRLLHVTDPHLSADKETAFFGEPPWHNLERVMGAIMVRDSSADLLLLGGDIADDQAPATYQQARVLLDRLPMPRLGVPGNHDDPDLLDRHLGTDADAPIAELRRLGWQLHLINSQIPDTVEGRIGEEQLAGLRDALHTSDAVAHLIVMHHDIAQEPGVGAGLLDPEPLLDVLLSSDARIVILSGHRHTAFGVAIGRLTVLVTPATSVQFNPRAEGLVPANPTMPAYRVLKLGANGHFTTEVVWLGNA